MPLTRGRIAGLYFPEICSIFLPTFARKKWAVTTFIWAFDVLRGLKNGQSPKKVGKSPLLETKSGQRNINYVLRNALFYPFSYRFSVIFDTKKSYWPKAHFLSLFI